MLTHPSLAFPYLVVLVSGGHSLILRVDGPCLFTRLAGTLDDSLGEAYDKVGRMVQAHLHGVALVGTSGA
jgi:N6-L-threonylcarbamoyladenine synthase